MEKNDNQNLILQSFIGWYFVQSTHVVLKPSGPFVCSACLVVKCVEQLSPKPRNQPNEQVGYS